MIVHQFQVIVHQVQVIVHQFQVGIHQSAPEFTFSTVHLLCWVKAGLTRTK